MRQVDDAVNRWMATAREGERLYVVIERRDRGWVWQSLALHPELAKDKAARHLIVNEDLERGLAEQQPPRASRGDR